MTDLIIPIIVSACLGALVGLIRQWSDQSNGGDADFGGVRTYALWAVLGCVAAFVSDKFSPAALPVAMALTGLHLTGLHMRVSDQKHPGTTTFAASLLTCLLGALVHWGYTQAAILVAATTAVMLGLKQPIHSWTRAFTPHDIRGTLQFIAITGVVLPLVPNRNFGPFDAFNPYSTWLMVVLISGLGFAGYIMMRLLGAQAGITITGLVGGLASSTATTLAFSKRSREEPELSSNYALAIVLACTIMLGRILAVIGVLNSTLAIRLVPAFALMAVPGALYAVWLLLIRKREQSTVETLRLHNPLGLALSIKFALIYAAVAFLVKAATSLGFQESLLPLSFLSGLTDMDAIALLMTNSAQAGTVSLEIAEKGIVLAAIGKSLLKAGLAVGLGSPALRWRVMLILGLTMLAGVGYLVVM